MNLTSDEIKREIEKFNKEIVQCLLDHDNLAMASYYADDAVIIGAGKFFANGREDVNRFCLNMNNKTWDVSIDKIEVEGKWVYQIGKSKSTWDNGPGDAGSYECNFMYLWERQQDGSYKIIIDCYN